MTDIFLYDTPILPEGFKFPDEYISMAHMRCLEDIEPWSLLFNDMATSLSYYGAMLNKYKDNPLIPFAIASDQSGLFNDGYVILACFDGSDVSGNPRVYFHDYGSSNKDIAWSERYYLKDFNSWLQLAREESAHYKAEQAEE